MTVSKHMFRGAPHTVNEIAAITRMHPRSIAKRIARGAPLDSTTRQSASAARHQERLQSAVGDEDVVLDDNYHFEQDIGAQVVLRLCGGRCTLEQLAALYGVSWQAMQQVERRAKRKFMEGMEALGLTNAMRENMRSRDAIRRESHADKMTRHAPGNIDLRDWAKTHSVPKLAELSNRMGEVNKEMLRYSQRGVKARLRAKARKAA